MRGFYSTVANIPFKLQRAIFSVANFSRVYKKATKFETVLRAPDVLS